MKKFFALAMLLGLGVFAVGCEKPKTPEATPAAPAEAAPAEAAPAEAAPAEAK
jgi:hypothetical protein